MGRQIRRSALRGSDPGAEISRLIWLKDHGGCREVASYGYYSPYSLSEPTTRWVRPDGSTCTSHRKPGQVTAPSSNGLTGPKSKSACYNPTSARERKSRRAKEKTAQKRGGAKPRSKAGT